MHQKGVDAVSWYNASGQWEEHAAYVGADGWVYDWRMLDGNGAAFKRWQVVGETLTGQVAVTRRLERVFIFVTSMSGKLFALEITNWAATLATPHQVATGLSATSMIAVGTSSTASYVRAFVSKPDNTISTFKYTGALPWQSANLTAPPGPGAAPCGLIATAEGQVSAQSHHTYLFCTRTGADHERIVYYRRAVGSGSMVFQGWGITTMPAQAVGTVATAGYGLTARRLRWNGSDWLEAYVVNGTSPYSSLHLQTIGEVAPVGMTDLGWDGETTAPAGGVVSGGQENSSYSEPFLLANAHDATWLYHKLSNNPGFVQDEWMNHGSADPWRNWATGATVTESSTALLGGRVIHAAIDNALQRIVVRWSTDGGDTWTGPTTMPIPAGYASMWDPVVDFDRSGKAYIIAKCRSAPTQAIFLWTTTDGTTFTMVTGGPLATQPAQGNPVPWLDHPWLQVYRSTVPLTPDEVHVVWGSPGSFTYNHVPSNQIGTIGQGLQTISLAYVGPPRMTVSQADGSAWIVWGTGICRSPVNGNCFPYVNNANSDYVPSGNPAVGGAPEGIQIPGTPDADQPPDGFGKYFRVRNNFSVVASPRIANQVYYAFQRTEDPLNLGLTNGLPFDVQYAVFTYNPADGQITTGTVRTADGQLGTNELMPELTVTHDAPAQGSDTIFLTYYDWGGVSCTISGVTYSAASGNGERCYRVSEMISRDQGQSFTDEQYLPIAPGSFVSDPARFPLMVPSGTDHLFMGDYHAVRGEILHSFHTAVTAPVQAGGPTPQSVDVDRGWVSHGYWNNSN